jgi:hypothetical protein
MEKFLRILLLLLQIIYWILYGDLQKSWVNPSLPSTAIIKKGVKNARYFT